MEHAKQKIEELMAQGKEFTYENFATKDREYGYPDAFSPAWVAWCTRVQGAITTLFGSDTPPANMLKTAAEVELLGNGRDKFDLAKSYYLAALKVAQDVLEEDTFGELKTAETTAPGSLSNRVFIVHGHDDRSKTELEVLLKEMGLEPIVLHRQPDQGQTIIEKFEKHADVGYAFVLLTPDEMAYSVSRDGEQAEKEKRARPNVIFEYGYFVGKLGRDRVCCLYTGDVTLPSDLDGLLYKKFVSSVEEVAYAITKELRACGYRLK